MITRKTSSKAPVKVTNKRKSPGDNETIIIPITSVEENENDKGNLIIIPKSTPSKEKLAREFEQLIQENKDIDYYGAKVEELEIAPTQPNKKAKLATIKKVTETKSKLYMVLAGKYFQKSLQTKLKYGLYEFPITSTMIGEVLPAVNISFPIEDYPVLKYLTVEAYALILSQVFRLKLVGAGSPKYNSLHPLFVPSLQLIIKYMSNGSIYSSTNVVPLTELDLLQDELYPTVQNYKKGLTSILEQPIETLNEKEFQILQKFFFKILDKFLNSIKSAKKRYDENTSIEEISYDLVSIHVSIGKINK